MLDLQYLIPQFLGLLLSLSVHEAAHAWTADRLGDPTARKLGRITLNPLAHIDWIGTVLFPLIAMLSGLPLLGWAKPVPVDPRHLKAPRRDFAVIAAAGPASNLLIAAVVALFVFVLGGAGAISSDFTWFLVVRTVLMNCGLAIFNLLPVPPLDGGNVAMGEGVGMGADIVVEHDDDVAAVIRLDLLRFGIHLRALRLVGLRPGRLHQLVELRDIRPRCRPA